MNNHIALYALNSFLKFERKIYHVFGLSLGRPIRMKTIIYALVMGAIILVIYFMPIIGNFINWIPAGILIVAPFGIAWLLSDIGTEDRSPMSYFRSFLAYQVRNIKGSTYFRNREVPKESEHRFNNYITFKDVEEKVTHEDIVNEKRAQFEQQKALNYIERMTNPEAFFQRMKEQEERKKRKGKLLFKNGRMKGAS